MAKFITVAFGVSLLGVLLSVLADDPAVKPVPAKVNDKETPPREFDLPKLTVRGVSGRYSLGSNVAVLLTLSQEIAATLEATIYHVKESGDLVLMSSTQVCTDAHGRQTAFAIGPPFGQWRAGKALLVIEPNLWPQMRESVEIHFEGVNAPQDVVREPITPANIVCDVSGSADAKFMVRPRQRFLVRGLLELPNSKDWKFAPPVMVDIVEPTINAAGMPQDLNHYSAATIPVRGKDGRFGFEFELKAPEEIKNFILRVKPMDGTIVETRKTSGAFERILSVTPTQPKP